jgi:hypothetical protein
MTPAFFPCAGIPFGDSELSQMISAASPSIAWTKLPDGAVLFSPETEVYYGLNEVAALVWEILSREPVTVDALCSAVHESFPDVPRNQINGDVVDLVTELQNNGLAKIAPSESAA